MRNDINASARAAYTEGVSPIEYAVQLAWTQMEVQAEVLVSRIDNPQAYPGYLLPLDSDAVARRIIGELLDAGWSPPHTTSTPRFVTDW